MKISYVALSFFPSQYASAINVSQTCNSLVSLGHLVRLYCLRPNFQVIAPSIGLNDFFEEVNIFLFKTNSFFFRLRLTHLILSVKASLKKPDAIFTRDFVVASVCLLLGNKVYYECHYPIRAWQVKFLKISSLRNKNGLVVGFISKALQKMSNFPQKKLFSLVVPDAGGVHKESVVPVYDCGYFGSLYEGRGIDLIFKVAERLPSLLFVIAGHGFIEKRIPANVCMLGNLKYSESLLMMKRCRFLLAPYQSKVTILGMGDTSKFMSPIKIFDYGLSGAIPLVSDLPSIREVCIDGENSLLVNSEDDEEWARVIHILCEDKEFAASLAKKFSRHWRGQTWLNRTQRIIDSL